MKVYKLTDEKGQTRNGCQWGEGVEHTASGEGELCTKGWLHWYSDPRLAVLLNPVHANFSNPILWEAEASGEMKHDRGLKSGSTKLKTIRQIPLPEFTTERRVSFGIRCALKVCRGESFVKWANAWLSGEDRTESAARAAVVLAAERAAARAASAAWAAWAAWAAAWVAASAAESAASAAKTKPIDFIKIIEEIEKG